MGPKNLLAGPTSSTKWVLPVILQVLWVLQVLPLGPTSSVGPASPISGYYKSYQWVLPSGFYQWYYKFCGSYKSYQWVLQVLPLGSIRPTFGSYKSYKWVLQVLPAGFTDGSYQMCPTVGSTSGSDKRVLAILYFSNWPPTCEEISAR